jgi:hypothetical protein
MTYHGGPLLVSQVQLYVVWYGQFTPTTLSLVEDFLTHYGNSSRATIVQSYYDATSSFVQGPIQFVSSVVHSNYTLGKNLSGQDVADLAGSYILDGTWPDDGTNQSIYMVIVDSNVTQYEGPVEEGDLLCDDYCAWHGYFDYGPSQRGMNLIFSGGVICAGQPWACDFSYQFPVTANQDRIADGIINLITHELDECITDPQITGWYNQTCGEMDDRCESQYDLVVGYTSRATPNVSYHNANSVVGNHDFYLPLAWVNDLGGYCALFWYLTTPTTRLPTRTPTPTNTPTTRVPTHTPTRAPTTRYRHRFRRDQQEARLDLLLP